jgi:16S rRNA (guanine527-N7)-methyltransferase
MHPARIAELLQPFLESANDQSLTASDLHHISTYIDILQRWNARINLTAIRDEEQIVTRHFGESLFAAQHLFPHGSTLCSPVSSVLKDFDVDSANDQRPTTNDRITVADIGSGAGFPGIPIKLWAPEIALTLIESNHKKVTFLREVMRVLTLTNINVFPARAEQLTDQSALFDVVTLRAVERLTEILPTAATLLAPGGRLALLVSSTQRDEACSILPHLTWRSPIPVPQSTNRILQLAHSGRDQNHDS